MQSRFLDRLALLPGTSRRLAPGALLFQRGDPVHEVFRVDTGEVHLLRRQVDGAEAVLQRAGPGALVAEASLLTPCYHCAAEATSPCRLTAWPRAAVLALFEDDAGAAMDFAAHLAGEVRSARLRAELMSLRRVADRVDAWLAWNENGLPEHGRRRGLARELGVTPEALYRELARRNAAG